MLHYNRIKSRKVILSKYLSNELISVVRFWIEEKLRALGMSDTINDLNMWWSDRKLENLVMALANFEMNHLRY